MSLIYKVLKEKCDDDRDLAPLLAQWEFDQKLLSNALRSIAYSFPHYSMHDESHSNTILLQIEKILGIERIRLLSGTDLWLILESAYSHDLGMVIPEKDKIEALESIDFSLYLEGITQDPNHESFEEAKLIKSSDIKELLAKSPKTWSLEVSKSLTILLADFFRRQHATRSKNILNQPTHIELSSPRTGLIPSRLFNVLGKITESHGKDYNYVMSLHQYEDGVASDKCHPRLISFLLRLGDLLDIDNGRFCPVMLSSFGRLPKTSETHLEKHNSIQHLYISQSHIEIRAKTKDYEVYSLLSTWFDWIKNEIIFLNGNLNTILPSVEFGGFPSANDLIVELLDYEVIENSQRPRIDIDADKVMEMLRGTNLYSSSNVFIREILQNSVDALMLRFFLEHESLSKTFESPKKMYEKFHTNDSYKIDITLSELQRDNGKLSILMDIEDSGIGISKEEISFLLKMGSSNKNSKRKKIVQRMPEWMKPSGFFGIGFHSIFQAVDNVTIFTKSIYDSFQYEIHFREKGKLVKIRKIESENNLVKSFTKISVEIDSERIPDRFSYKYDNKKALEIISNYDSLLDDNFPIEKENLIYDITTFASEYSIPVLLNGVRINNSSTNNSEDFCKESNCYLSIYPMLINMPGSEISFRNQKVLTNNRELYFPYLQFNLDILNGKADDFLSFSREKLTNDGIKRIRDILEKEIPVKLESLYLAHGDKRKEISLAYHSNFSKPTSTIRDDWKNFEISEKKDSNKKKKLRELLDQNAIDVHYEDRPSSNKNLEISFEYETYIIDQRLDIVNFLVIQLFKEYRNFQLLSLSSISESRFVGGNIPINENLIKKDFKFSKTSLTEDEIFSRSVIVYFFQNFKLNYSSRTQLKRTYLPLLKYKYQGIAIDYNFLAPNLPYIQPIYRSDFDFYQKCIINPFVIENGNWIAKGLEEAKKKTFKIKTTNNDSITLDEISNLFNDLVEEIEGMLYQNEE
ncbi:ATP-binding protein [Leptospira bandrabouensis]|uniref:HD domain-containing protein n=3 Tax=Leptospira bandrabouensis TaxID=2484903 RepID=UPI00223D8A1E|nr:ATP-binding protein [Leptospira bandrabouensis]MCW7476651.1 ATP-binding protein [Leptospira bandrabouensis]MCW7484333.1 ATP-binding protein [Leptospira bandrabouensis]